MHSMASAYQRPSPGGLSPRGPPLTPRLSAIAPRASPRSPSPRRVHHCAASGPGPKKLSETKLGSTNVMAISIGLPTPLVEWTSAERSASHPTSEHHRPSSLTPPRVAYTLEGAEHEAELSTMRSIATVRICCRSTTRSSAQFGAVATR